MIRRGLLAALSLACGASAAAAQHAVGSRHLRVIGVVRDPAGAPVGGAVVWVNLPRQITFTGKDGSFELARSVSDSAQLEVLHLAYARPPLRVSELPRASPDSTTAVAILDLHRAPIDSTPAPYAPPLRSTAPSLPDAELELITRAARLPSLRHAARSSGHREIRVFIHGGAGTPDHAAILRRRQGHVSGEVWLWWLLDPTFGLDPATNARLRAGAFGCAEAPWQWGTVLEASIPDWRAVLVCRATLPVTPDWRGMWRRLDSLGVWRLPDQTARLHNRRPFVTDGAFVTLEMFDGRTYRLVRHGHPDSSAAPAAQRAAAIVHALQDAFQAVKLEPARWTPTPVTYHISGTVRDTGGRPILDARITIPALPFSMRTAADGGFDVPFPVSFTAWLGVEHPGYRSVRYPVHSLPRPSYGPGTRIRTEIVLQVAPDTTVVSDPPGHYIRIRGFTGPGPLVAPAAPPWATRVRYGGGPSMGAPRSDFDGSRAPLRWCLPVGAWERASAALLTDLLRDTTEFGAGWRGALSDAPVLLPSDTATVVLDEAVCQQAAAVINRDLLGWDVAPPIFLLRIKDRLVAFPSNASMGEFGFAVQLDLSPRILGVATW